MNVLETINCVGIDVSKGKSTIAIMRPLGEIVESPYEVSHTSSDLKDLVETIQKLEGETRIVMEYTGKYYQPIARYLYDAGFFVCVVHAKLVHDFANNSIRKIKTDKADAVKIANYGLTNWDTLKPYSKEEETRELLKTHNRQYNMYMKQYVVSRNNFISILDQTFPGLNGLFPHSRRPDGKIKWVDIAMRFWHCECVSQHSFLFFQKSYNKWCLDNDYRKSSAKAEKIYKLACECVPSLPKNEHTRYLVLHAAMELSDLSMLLLDTQRKMDELASSLPEYPIVLSMTGVGKTLGPQLMAEIGDVRRFPHRGQLIAFAGVDAPPFQSGKYESHHRHISKRGSSDLRKSMFQVISCLCQHQKEDDPIYQFIVRKRAEGKPYYVCMVAGCNKFLRIYYARVKEYLNNLELQA